MAGLSVQTALPVEMICRARVLLPIVLYIALRAFAHAHPPNPSRIHGVYDATDVDDILQAFRSLVGLTKTAIRAPWLLSLRAERLPPSRTPASARRELRPFHSRAPPTPSPLV